MGIQQRLKKNRYGPYALQLPTKEDMLDVNIKIEHIRRRDPDLLDTIIYTLLNPPQRDRYYNHYIGTVNLYHEHIMCNPSKATKDKATAVLVNRHIIGRLLYYYMFPQQCGNSFSAYSQAWLTGILFAMRASVIKQKYNLGLIPTHKSSPPWTCAYIPFPKPMGERAMLALADRLHDVCEGSMNYIAKRSGIII